MGSCASRPTGDKGKKEQGQWRRAAAEAAARWQEGSGARLSGSGVRRAVRRRGGVPAAGKDGAVCPMMAQEATDTVLVSSPSAGSGVKSALRHDGAGGAAASEPNSAGLERKSRSSDGSAMRGVRFASQPTPRASGGAFLLSVLGPRLASAALLAPASFVLLLPLPTFQSPRAAAADQTTPHSASPPPTHTQYTPPPDRRRSVDLAHTDSVSLKKVVDVFYEKVLADARLAPVFRGHRRPKAEVPPGQVYGDGLWRQGAGVRRERMRCLRREEGRLRGRRAGVADAAGCRAAVPEMRPLLPTPLSPSCPAPVSPHDRSTPTSTCGAFTGSLSGTGGSTR